MPGPSIESAKQPYSRRTGNKSSGLEPPSDDLLSLCIGRRIGRLSMPQWRTLADELEMDWPNWSYSWKTWYTQEN
eukprot:4997925-Prorocentrum_lima.AAC.1